MNDWRASRDWWRDKLGFEVEFEMPDARVVAMRDDAGLTVFLGQADGVSAPPGLTLTVQVADVDAKAAELAAAGVRLEQPPQKLFWGYGAELRDPNGYLVRLWDEASMNAKGDG